MRAAPVWAPDFELAYCSAGQIELVQHGCTPSSWYVLLEGECPTFARRGKRLKWNVIMECHNLPCFAWRRSFFWGSPPNSKRPGQGDSSRPIQQSCCHDGLPGVRGERRGAHHLTVMPSTGPRTSTLRKSHLFYLLW